MTLLSPAYPSRKTLLKKETTTISRRTFMKLLGVGTAAMRIGPDGMRKLRRCDLDGNIR
ncbi:MAG: twin-arginine translocation signal domain-containing protein [Eggerthellaceae bacterium]